MAILVCRTCPRDTPQAGSFGDLFKAPKDAGVPNDAKPAKLFVNCLGACDQAGAVALDCGARARVRFSGVLPEHVADIEAAAELYEASESGDPADWEIPTAIRGLVSAVSPKRRPLFTVR